MDVATCAVVSVAETLLAWMAGLSASHGFALKQTATTLFLLQYFALKFYRCFLYHKFFSPLRHLPGPTDNHLLLGQSINFLHASSPIELYVKWMKQWPDAPFIRYLTFGNEEVLLVNSIKAHKEVQQTHCYSFIKPQRFRKVVKEFAGDGVLVLEGEEHRAHRRMLANPLSIPKIKKLQPIFEAKSQELSKLLGNAVAGSNGRIDCTEVFTKVTLDIIGATVLGLDLENLSSTNFSIQDDTATSNGYSFYDAYEIIFEQGMLGKILLFANSFFPVRWIPIKANYDWAFCNDWIKRVLQGAIESRRADTRLKMTTEKAEDSSTESRDLLTFIVEESMPGRPAEGLGENHLLGHLMQLMVAGHATSADTITWCVYIMATNPNIQDTLRAEINSLIARTPNPDYNEINSCAYMEGVIKEALRIYAPSTSHHREAAKEMTIHGIPILKGTTLDIVPSVTSLNPTIWGTDADTPDPSRWDRLSGDQASPYAFQAFANGPRICLGKSYAMLEIKCVLLELVPKFRFHAIDKPFTIENPGFAMRPKGLEVHVERIVSL